VATNSVTLPQWTPGDYFLVLRADDNNWLVESSEVNNVVVVPVTLVLPDLAPVGLSAPGAALSGSSIQVVCTVTNQGNGAALGSWYDYLYLSTNAVWDSGDSALASVWLGNQNLTNGTSYARTNTVSLPQWVGGTYYLIFKTDANNYLFESVETNNTSVAVPIRLIGDKPLLEATLSPYGQPVLTLYGPTNVNYTLESTTNLAVPVYWASNAYIVIARSNLWQVLEPLDATNRPIFFRALRLP
jgi:subtilase family serine protease